MSPPQLPEMPEPLKVLKPFLSLANLHDNRDLVVAYWARLEAIQRGLQISTASMEETQFLMILMEWLERTKKENHENEAITNEMVALAHLENRALKLFLYADGQDRAGVFNKNVIQAFYTASLIYELTKTFEPLNEEAERNMKYAKWKSVYISNCLKKGETPVSGPLETEGEDNSNEDMAEETEDVLENDDGEYLDAVAMHLLEKNDETKEDDKPAAETEGGNSADNEENENPEPEGENNEEGEGENPENKTEEESKPEGKEENEEPLNEDENKDEEETENQVPTEENNEEEIDNPDTEDKNEEDHEEDKSVGEFEEANNDEEASTSKDKELDFPSVPSSGSAQEAKESNTDIPTPATPNQYNPAPTPTNGGSEFSFGKKNITVKTEGGVELSAEQMVRAQKLIKWAGSALNYDDVPTAVSNLQKALNLLTLGQEGA